MEEGKWKREDGRWKREEFEKRTTTNGRSPRDKGAKREDVKWKMENGRGSRNEQRPTNNVSQQLNPLTIPLLL